MTSDDFPTAKKLRLKSGEQLLDLTSDWGASILGPEPEIAIAAARSAYDAPCFSEHGINAEHEEGFGALLKQLFGNTGTILPATIGSEAVDLAVRASRRMTKRRRVLHLARAFHGVTLGAAALCGISNWVSDVEKDGIGLQIDFTHDGVIAERTRRDIEAECARGDVACCVMEPVIGNSGFVHLDTESLAWLTALCKSHDILLIADEILCGLGRCGAWTSAERVGLVPDMVLIGKGLGAGAAAIAAVLCRPGLDIRADGPALRSTYSWTPVACAVASAVLHHLQAHDLVARASRLRAECDGLLQDIAACPNVSAVHGKGLGIGIGLLEQAGASRRLLARRRLRERGIVVGANPNLPGLWLAPALNMRAADLQHGLGAIRDVLIEMSSV